MTGGCRYTGGSPPASRVAISEEVVPGPRRDPFPEEFDIGRIQGRLTQRHPRFPVPGEVRQEKAPVRGARDEGFSMLAPGSKTLEIGDVQCTLTAGRLVATLAAALQQGLDFLGVTHPRSRFLPCLAPSEEAGHRQDGNAQNGNQTSHFARSAIIG